MRIGVWWSFWINSWSRRRLQCGPIHNLESILGHCLQVRTIERDPKRRGVYHVDAWSYLETQSLEQGSVAVLKQVQRLASPVLQAFAFNSAPTSQSDDVISFYWGLKEQFGLPKVFSTGVLLKHDPNPFEPVNPRADEDIMELWRDAGSLEHQSLVRSAPLITLLDIGPSRNFNMDFDIRIQTSTKRKLLDYHWPKFKDAWFKGDIDLIDITDGPHKLLPYKLTARRSLTAVTDDEAIAACLTHTAGHNLRSEFNSRTGQLTRFTSASNGASPLTEGIAACRLEPLP